MKLRKKENRERGFKMVETVEPEINEFGEIDFSKMRVGAQTLEDAVLNLTSYKKVNPKYGDKNYILQAINKNNYETCREISNYFYNASGIYSRLCKYLAFLYRYDWYIIPYANNIEKVKENLILKDFARVLQFLDASDVKRMFGNIALDIMKNGVYYGYIIDFNDRFSIQQLPAQYCRSRFSRGNDPVIELNLSFFDSQFPIASYRIKVLKMFPKEIQKAYVLYKEGKLQGDYPGDSNGWYMLDPNCTVQFCLNHSEFPPLVGAIPSIIDLDQAQELDRKKTMQQLLKILIQKLPLDKNGELLFDPDEAVDVHNNAVAMLRRAVGVDVLTTFCEVDVENMQDAKSVTSTDDLQKIERTVYNNLGVSQNLFNTDGNLALDKSISNDEASMKDLVYQFQNLLNRVIARFNKSAYNFSAQILETTIYNYKELSKMYKEHTQIGYSKMLPQVALGHSQSSILAAAQFENKLLKLSEIMIPPLMSSTMSSKNVGNSSQTNNNKSQNKQENNTNLEEKAAGRPEKPDDEKTEKTIQNKESMN